MSPCEVVIEFSVLWDVFYLQMIARGKNASDLFPAVVKNVACKNIEVCNELSFMSTSGFICFSCPREPVTCDIRFWVIRQSHSCEHDISRTP